MPPTPVILVHGYLAPRALMLPMRWRLGRDGFDAHTVDLPTLNLASVERCAHRMALGIDRILARTGAQRCDLVGVSLGGLMGIHYLQHLGGAPKVRRLLTVGTPVRGTWAAAGGIAAFAGLSPSAWECLPTSSFVASLLDRPLPDSVEVVAIYGSFDPIAPKDRCRLPEAPNVRNVEVPLLPNPAAHQALVLSEGAYRAIVDALQ